MSVPAGSGAKERRGRKVRCNMQAHDWVHGFPQFKLQGTLKIMFNDAMTMGACSEDASLHV